MSVAGAALRPGGQLGGAAPTASPTGQPTTGPAALRHARCHNPMEGGHHDPPHAAAIVAARPLAEAGGAARPPSAAADEAAEARMSGLNALAPEGAVTARPATDFCPLFPLRAERDDA